MSISLGRSLSMATLKVCAEQGHDRMGNMRPLPPAEYSGFGVALHGPLLSFQDGKRRMVLWACRRCGLAFAEER